MSAQDLAMALQRAESMLRGHPELGVSQDAPATARWDGGTRVVTRHANGTQLQTDMPRELGGSGDRISPGWLLRAGLASCTATCIAMAAATEGIELESLELRAISRSDARGLLGMTGADGERADAGPREMQLLVRISAHGVSPDRLRALVEAGQSCSPVACAIQEAVPVGLQIEIGGG